jgi:hypothetical protein
MPQERQNAGTTTTKLHTISETDIWRCVCALERKMHAREGGTYLDGGRDDGLFAETLKDVCGVDEAYDGCKGGCTEDDEKADFKSSSEVSAAEEFDGDNDEE